MSPRRRPRPWVLLGLSVAVAAAVGAPLVFLLLQAGGAGAGHVAGLIGRPLTVTLLWNTVRLTVVVTAACAVIGTAAAWFVERTELPGRRCWAVLVVVPLAIPDFVISFGWASLSPRVAGFGGAVLVMTLAVYPLVYLPVASSFRNADPGAEEVARSLGVGRLRILWSITLGQARTAIAGGCVLVALVLLAEYGAFEILGYRTFTTEIFTEFTAAFNIAAASALSIVLVALSVVVLAGEAALRHRGRLSRSGPGVARVPARRPLGRSRPAVLAGFAALVTMALGVPVGSALYWMFGRDRQHLSGVGLLGAALHTAGYAAAAGALATLMALPLALLAVRHRSRARMVLERSTSIVLAMPGLVIALALSYFTERYLGGFGYQTTTLLIVAYAILFFPMALVGVRASVAQAPVGLEELSRSLGQGHLATFGRVTLPLVAPGLGAAFCLVFLSVVTELTATLVLVPTGVQTLATQFWAYEQNLSYAQAAPFALVMIVVAAGPSYVLGRYFDRLPARRTS